MPAVPSPTLRRTLACLVAAHAGLGAQGGLFVEPFGARVLANPRVVLRDQTLRGIEGGVLIGGFEVAGQWAQATTADFRTARPAQLVGGSVRIPLPSFRVRPYLLAGAARVTFDPGFTTAGPPPRNRWIGEAGGGLLVPLYGGVQLDLGVRDLILRADSAAGPLDTTRILMHNLQLRAGLRLQLGGRRTPPRPAPTVIVEQGAPRSAPAPAPARGAVAGDARPAPVFVPVPVPAGAPAPQGAPQVLVRTAPAEAGVAPTIVAVPQGSALPGQVSFPAPAVGEVTIRYGAASGRDERARAERVDAITGALGAPVADTTLARLRATLDRALADLLRPTRAAPARRGSAPSPLQHFADSVRLHDVGVALQRYVDAYGTARARRVADSALAVLASESAERARLAGRIDSLVALRALDDAERDARRAADSLAALARDVVPRDPALVAGGVSFGIGSEVVVGGRLDYGAPVRRLPALRLLGEVGVGAGTLGTSTSISGLAQYRLPALAGVHPFVEGGLALLNLTTPRAGLGRGLSLVPDVGLGARLPVGARDAQGRGRLIVLVRGINPSRVTRLLVGWSVR